MNGAKEAGSLLYMYEINRPH